MPEQIEQKRTTMPYKVIFRAAWRGNAKESDTAQPLTWEPGCPIMFEVIQIARNPDTGKAFLQAKVRNISDAQVDSFHARLAVSYRNGSVEEFDVEPLDADIAPGDNSQIQPLQLEDGDALSAEGVVLSVRSAAAEWRSEGAAATPPVAGRLDLSPEALEERAKQLAECSTMSADDAAFALREEQGWWLCPCGQPNVGASRCARCGAPLDTLRAAEDQDKLERDAEQRAQREEKQKKLVKIAAVVAAIVIVAILAWVLFIRPAITETVYRATGIISYDEDVPGEVLSETSLELDGKGNPVNGHFDSGSDDDYAYFTADPETGVESALSSSSYTEYTAVVDETDEFGQPTRITRTDEYGDDTTITIEYYGEGHIKRIEREYSDGDVSVYEYDENGYRIFYSSTYYSSYSRRTETTTTTSTYEFDDEGRAITRTDEDENGNEEVYSYTYDENGNIASIVNGDDPTSRFIDAEYSYEKVENPSPWARAVSNLKPSVSPL